MKVTSVTRVVLPKYEVRVWRLQTESYIHKVRGFTDADVTAHTYQELPVRELAMELLALPDVVKVEVLDWDSNGIVLERDDG